MAGAVVYRAEVEEGTEVITVPSRKLRNGTFVYCVSDDNTILEKGKIIAR